MVISKELASALDELKETIAAAEKYLSDIPTASDAYASVELPNDNRSYFIIFKDGRIQLCQSMADDDEIPDTSTTWTLDSLNIMDRVRASEQIDDLVAMAESDLNELPETIKQIISTITLRVLL